MGKPSRFRMLFASMNSKRNSLMQIIQRDIWIRSGLTTLLLTLATFVSTAANAPRERLLLDFGWKFHLGNDWGSAQNLMKAGASFGPTKSDFNDLTWRPVNIPHDWAVELPFDKNSELYHGYKPVGSGFP